MNRILNILVLLLLFSCTGAPEEKKESVEAEKTAVSEGKEVVANTPLVLDYMVRVLEYRKMPDATPDQQIAKYEIFSDLYIEYLGIHKNESAYPAAERKTNDKAFTLLRDETVLLKEKLKESIPLLTKDQESRLDQADSKVNAVIKK